MIMNCPYCNSQFQCIAGGRVECPSCRRIVDLTDGSNWDKEKGGDWTSAFFNTFKKAMFEPVLFFTHVAGGHGMSRPFIFALIVSYVMFGTAIAYQAGFQMLAAGINVHGYLGAGIFPEIAISLPIMVVAIAMFLVFGVPFMTAIMIFCRAGLYHICLMILGAAKRDFAATFRTVCYATSPQLLHVVPLFGALVAGMWQIALDIIGLKVVHETTYGRSALAVFLPMIVCCGAVALILFAVAGGVVAALIKA